MFLDPSIHQSSSSMNNMASRTRRREEERSVDSAVDFYSLDPFQSRPHPWLEDVES